MDCNCNQRSAGSCRPQMPPTPCMNTNCGMRPPCGVKPSCGVRPACGTVPPVSIMPDMNVLQPSGCRPDKMPCSMDPVNMPAAMAYVPWQQWRQTYPMEKGFSRGTIFPELDLPFVMGRCR